MKSLFKYIGIFAILLFSFYYTEKMSNIVINNSALVKEINQNSDDYNITPVSAIIEDDYIVPGLNGYSVNVLKSYNNMKFLDTFNSYYLEFDKITPDISLENNKDKIIKYGNKNKLGVALIVQDNLEIIDYSKSKNIKITRLINEKTFDNKASYEQINNDYNNYNKLEVELNNKNINKNICFVSNNIVDICRKNKKYLVEESIALNNYNISTIKENINSGSIILIGDNVSLADYKILVRQILYQDLKILPLSELINEEEIKVDFSLFFWYNLFTEKLLERVIKLSKIKIFGLGGLAENGKNSYVVEIDNDIFVFDCGLKYANSNLLGIDYIMPDFSYLIKNKKKIKGIFITHGHSENMGSIADLVKDLPMVRIYATKFTKFVLMEYGILEKNIVEIKPHKKLNFDNNVSIFPISVSHSIPDSVMYIINSKDGAICYTGDFVIDPTMLGSYDMDLGKIAYIGKQGVLCMMCESSFSEKKGHTSPNHRLEEYFKDIIKHNDKRIIFSLLPYHLYTINDIFNAAKNTHRKIIIMGKKLQNVVNFAVKEKYLEIENGIIGDLSNINDDNSILLISDERTNPYANVSKILHGYDKYINLKNSDTIVFAEPRYDSNEKTLVKLENELAKFGCNIINLPSDKIILHHPSTEDLMLMIKLIQPKYYMPVKGEYRYMVNNANLANRLGIKPENIILKQNGEIVTFEQGKLVNNNAKIKVNDVLIDGLSNEDVGELVIKDREMLSENGIVLISATISKKDKVMLVGPEVTTRGFIYVKDSKDLIKEIKNICENIITRNISPSFVDYNKIKVEIREELSNYLYQETECKPMIIAVVQEV